MWNAQNSFKIVFHKRKLLPRVIVIKIKNKVFNKKSKRMKEFRIINIAENFINEINERVLIIELAEAKYGITLPSGQKTYTFDVKGE